MNRPFPPIKQFPPMPSIIKQNQGASMNSTNGTLNADKLFSRMFRRVDNVVWDLMTGRVGVRTPEGIATLEGVGEDARVNLNLMDDFGFSLPAYAQSTPKNGVQVGDIIFRNASNDASVMWVIDKTEDDNKQKFKVMKLNGETASWNPPKVSMMGFDSGVMVLRSLSSMLPGGSSDLSQMQNMLMPLVMMGGEDIFSGGNSSMDKMMPFMLMQMMNGGDKAGMGNMMQMAFMMQMLKK